MNIKKVMLVSALAGIVTLGGLGIAQKVNAATIVGTVDNVTASQITVEGLTIYTDNNTKIEGNTSPGALVKIKTTTRNDGLPLAVKIEAKDDNRAIKIEGIVDNVTGNQITINGKTVFTDNQTHIKGTLAPGAEVEIKARLQNDGSLLAFKIEVEDGDDEDEGRHGKYAEINGVTSNVTGTSLVVNGKTIKIDDATKIKGTLVNGARLEVKAITQSDGSLLAVKISVNDAKKRGHADEDEGEDDDD